MQLSHATPLDDYVNKPDNTYAWTDLGIPQTGPGFTGKADSLYGLPRDHRMTMPVCSTLPQHDVANLVDLG